MGRFDEYGNIFYLDVQGIQDLSDFFNDESSPHMKKESIYSYILSSLFRKESLLQEKKTGFLSLSFAEDKVVNIKPLLTTARQIKRHLAVMDLLTTSQLLKSLAHRDGYLFPIFIDGSMPFMSKVFPYNENSSSIIYDQETLRMTCLEVDQLSLTEDWSLWPHIFMGLSHSKMLSRMAEFEFICFTRFHRCRHLKVFGAVLPMYETLYIKPYIVGFG